MMEKRICAPTLRFSEHEDAWQNNKIRDYYLLISGQHLNPDEYTTTTSAECSFTPYFTGPSDFTNDESKATKWVVKAGKEALRGDVLFTVKGSGVGTMLFLNLPKVVIGRQLMAIRSNSASSLLLFHYLDTKKHYYQGLAYGNMIPGLSRNDILDTKLCFPSLAEQNKIANFLTAVDSKIQQLSEKKRLLEQYKKGVMQQIFDRQIRFKDGNGKDYPNWEEKRMIDLLAIKYGKDQKQVTSEDGKYPIFGTGGEIGRTNQFLYDQPSVLIGRKGTINKPRYMETPFWTVDTLFYTEIKGCADPKWIYYKFETINWYLYNEASGVPSLSASTINKIRFEVPCLEEQTKIANLLSEIDEKINHVNRQVEQTRQYKKGLLQQMFV